MSWADQFNTYEEACIYYGADTPAQLQAEAEAEHREWLESMEAAFGPYVPAVPPIIPDYNDFPF